MGPSVFSRAGLALLSAATLAGCLPQNHIDDQVSAAIEAGTFANPSANVRPRFRYWLPDASANLSRVTLDIADAKLAGAGGVEVLGYYLYNTDTTVPTDWTTYGWGTPAWKTLFDTIIKAHRDNGLIMDFAMGPNQGQGVPAHEDDEGLMWDIRLFNQTVPIGGSFNGALPGWGTGQLQAAITGLVTSSINASDAGPGLPIVETIFASQGSAVREQNTLSTDSLQDVTHQLSSNGTLNLTFPSDSVGLHYTVFAVYLIQMHYRAAADPATLTGPETAPQDFLHNGSWTVDHFSARGAKVMTDFWDQYLLVDGTKEALMEVANYAWEDSCEIKPAVFWTKDLPQAFQSNRGYSVNKWLPTLFHQNSPNSAATWWITDEEDSGNSHIADYRSTITELYGEYLTTLTEWANSNLDIQFSAQVSYNMALDMANIKNVNGPECESLGFNHVIDAYRQYAGPANIAGKRIISTECGATYGEVYQQTLPSLLWDVKRSVSGGINNFIFHGYPYSGNYGLTTWPQFTTFGYLFAEMHGRHQPAWDFYSDSLDYAARLQYVFQSGIPKRDLAFYQKFTSYVSVPRNYQPTDLEQAGYTYEYLNPDNLEDPNAAVQRGILAPERQAFKALIVRANDSMTVPGVERIADIAHCGFPVIFSGGLPSYLASYNASGSAYINSTLKSLTRLSNVHVVPYDKLAATISSLNIRAATIVNADNIWYTYWRNKGSSDYIFVYNDAFSNPLGGGSSQGTVEFQSTGKPYLLDAWTGVQTPILNYTQSKTSTTIYFELAGNQSVIVAFENKERAKIHITEASPGVLSFSIQGSAIVANVGSTPARCRTSDGRSHSLPPSRSAPITLSNWTLIVEHWNAPSDLTDMEIVAVKSNTTHSLPTLESWQSIPGLQNVSGRGHYSSSFNLEAGHNGGAIIDFGAIVHTIRVSINGHTLPPLDTTRARADITPYLVNGENRVEAVVSTTLGNRLIPIWTDLRASGLAPVIPAPLPQDYGLLFDVVVTPYTSTVVYNV